MRGGRVTQRRWTRSGRLDDMVRRQPTDFRVDTGSPTLVYLIHGVTGTPTEMHYVARGLARRGWDVYATTLPGHCTRLRDLVRTSEDDWRRHVHTQLNYARQHYPSVFVVGLSAGGLLALEAATSVAVDGVGVLSPTFTYDGWNTPWTHALLRFGMTVIPRHLQLLFFHRDKAPFGIKDETLQARIRTAYSPLVLLRKSLRFWWVRRNRRTTRQRRRVSRAAATGYPLFPLKTMADLDCLITRVRACLGTITTPTVILQAREDDVTSPRNAYLVYDQIGSKQKHVILLEDCYHVITVDKQKQAVVKHLIDFFGRCRDDGASRPHEFQRAPSLGSCEERLVSRETLITNGHSASTTLLGKPH